MSESKTNFTAELIATARAIAAPGKGILAADESTGTIGKRFAGINVENTRENRKAYRHLLFTTKGLNEFISGCITFEETLFEKDDTGKGFAEILKEAGIIPGIKVDKGVRVLPKEARIRGLLSAEDLHPFLELVDPEGPSA